MKVLLYGGTFDPPHNGHLNNLRAAADRVRPDKVVVMPAGLSPFKQHTSAPGALRLEMCSCFHALEEGMDAIRSRCISFAVAPVPPEQCARYCAAQGVDKKTAALYSELFDGHIGTVLAAAQDEARTTQVEKALQLAKTAADRDSYAAAVLLAPYEKDKAGAAALLTDFRAVAAAGLRQSPHAPVQGDAARRALRLADAAIQRLGAQVNPKIVLSVFAAKFRAL